MTRNPNDISIVLSNIASVIHRLDSVTEQIMKIFGIGTYKSTLMLFLRNSTLTGRILYRFFVKRLIDICVAVILVFLLSPLFFGIALLIILLNGRPVLFHQTRIGFHGKPFKIYKFRTMTNKSSSYQTQFVPGDRTRVTSLGRLLRRTKLDEFPQLLNVIRGDMALVGPRPEVPKWTQVFPARWKKVHSVRPGITDHASLIYKNEEDILSTSSSPEQTYHDDILPKKLNANEKYVDNYSIVYDWKLIVKTIVFLFR